MKRIGLIATVGIFFALSPHCAAGATTPPASQPTKAETFLLVKVQGTIGEDFTAAKMKAAISEARTAKAAALVLSMDTPGGSVTEAEAIVNLIIENKDLRFIALVNKALSAGAAITLACKEIYVMETATIGAAVSYVADKSGRPMYLSSDVAEKMQSAWRAVCRKAADHGGHSSLLAEGMIDKDFAITKRTENGKVILERDGKGEVVKASGRILTLTAKEAVACGLAKAVVPDVVDLGAKLRMREWRKPGSADVAEERDRPTVRLPEVRTLLSQYRVLRQNATATTAAVTAKEEEIRKKLIGRTIELAGTLIDVRSSRSSLVVTVSNRSENQVSYYGYYGGVETGSVESIWTNMLSPDNRWLSAKKGSRVVATGRIRNIELTGETRERPVAGPNAYRGTEGPTVFLLRVVISMEEIGPQEVLRQPRPAREPNSTASAPVDAEAEARRQLNLAENYRSVGAASKALGILRSIIEDFPNTAAAKEAKEQIKQMLEDETKKAGKGS